MGISRLVVLSPNWLGDAVMALPAIDDVRRHFREARLAVAARASLAPLFDRVPGVDAVVSLGGPRRARSGADLAALRAEGSDLAILLPNSFHAAWLARRAGIAERWGYRADLRRPLLTRSVRRPNGPIHQGAYYQHLVEALEIVNGPLRPHVTVSDHDRMAGGTLLEHEGWTGATALVGLAPGAAYGFAKQWPPDRFADLARLLAERGAASVLVGLPSDREVGRHVMEAFERSKHASALAGRVLNLIGRTSIGELMGVMTHCAGFVANDSGAAHLAGAVGLPVVAIFGPTDERIGAPLSGRMSTATNIALSHDVFCRPCWLRECPIDHRCMKRVDPPRVLQAVVEQIEGALNG